MSERIEPDEVRAWSDGEVDPVRAEALARRAETDGALRAGVVWETELRHRVAVAMRPAEVPDELDRRVRSILAEEGGAQERPRRSWLAGPTKANWFAVAACLVLVAGAVLFGIFGHPIDAVRRAPADLMGRTAAYTVEEHMRCSAHRDTLARDATWATLEEARARMPVVLGAPVVVADLHGAGFEFIAAAACQMPGSGAPSARISYARNEPADDGCDQVLLSVFVEPDTGQFADVLGTSPAPWTWVRVSDYPRTAKAVACCTDGRALYFLVCCNDRELIRIADLITPVGSPGRP